MNVAATQNSNGQRPARRVAAEATASTASSLERMMGTAARDAFVPSAVLKEAASSSAMNIPFDAIFSSQEYRRGELKANEYVAKIVANSIGFGAWTIGGAAATAALAPFALPAVAVGVIGFAVGMTAQDLFDRFCGHSLAKSLAKALPEADVKGVADAFTRYIANPLCDYVWNPIADAVMGNKVLTAGALGLLALKFPGAAKAVASHGGTMGGGMALGMVAGMGVSKLLGESADPFAKAGSDLDPQVAKAFQDGIKSFMAKGMTPSQAQKATKDAFLSLMLKKGASQVAATALVDQLAQATPAAPSATRGFLATR